MMKQQIEKSIIKVEHYKIPNLLKNQVINILFTKICKV